VNNAGNVISDVTRLNPAQGSDICMWHFQCILSSAFTSSTSQRNPRWLHTKGDAI